MQVVQVHRTGGPEVLTPGEVADPTAGPGELLVEVAAVGVNYKDVYERTGAYPLPDLPAVPGSEAAGTVRCVGEGVTDVSPGDVVAWATAPGSYAELVRVPAAAAVAVPDGVSPEVAAALMLQGMTAQYLVDGVHPLGEGETVVVHAAAGGVGLLLVQLAKLRGARVLATVSTEEKAGLARGAGADDVAVGYVDVPGAARRLSGGRGADVVYDGVGAATFDDSLASLRPRGLLALFGQASGPVAPFDLQRLNRAGGLFLTRPSLAHYAADREELLYRAGDVLGLVAQGRLDVRVGGRYPLAQARRAHEDLEARRTTGKLLLLP